MPPVAGHSRGAEGRLGAGEFGLGLRMRRLGRLEVLPSRDLCVEQPPLAVECGACRLRPRRGGGAFGDDGRRVAALQERDRLAGADRIAETLEDSGERSVGSCGQRGSPFRRGGDRRLGYDLGADRARAHGLGPDAGRGHPLRGHRHQAFRPVLFLFAVLLFASLRLHLDGSGIVARTAD